MDIDAQFDAIRSRDPTVHVIPTTAAWFSWTKIHPIEERSLPSFFNGKWDNRSSDVYMEIRNSIMKMFHKDPKTLIEMKDLTELTSGELDARREVMEFLDHWGLINFHPFPVVDSKTVETDTGGLAKKALLVDKLYQFEVAAPSFHEVGPKAEVAKQAAAPLKLLSESTIADEMRPEGPSVEYHCNSCSADCSRRRYHCQKQADFDLCSECYNNGKFDSGMSPADFILMEPAEVPGISGGSWTDQETLLLLEALELFGGNWSEIAEHVATKSKAQCILHFVQMPIEDTFLEGMDDFDSSLPVNNGPGSVCDDTSALKESHERKESVTGNGSSSLTKSTETTESKCAPEKGPLSPKLDASDSSQTVEVKVAQDVSANFAINALKEAFQAIGSEDAFSFADSGNPVMALAAFLSALVEPDVAAASARSSVKATKVESPGIHLASKHCFILEDPPEDLKDPPAPERNCSADTEMLDAEAQKEDDKAQKHELSNMTKDEPLKEEHFEVQNKISVEVQKDEKPKEEDLKGQSHMTDMDDNDVSKKSANKEIEDTVSKETAVPDGGKEKCKVTDVDDMIKADVAIGNGLNISALPGQDLLSPQDGSLNKLDKSALPVEDQLSPQNTNKGICVSKESNDLTEKEDVGPSNTMEADDVVLNGKDLPISVNGSGESTIPSEIAPNALKESTSIGPPEKISQIPEQPKNVDNDSLNPSKSNDPQEEVAHASAPSDSKVPQVAVAPSSVPSENTPSSEVARVPLNESSSIGPLEVTSQSAEAPKDVDMDSGLTPSERRDSQEVVAHSSVSPENKDSQETTAPSSALSENAPSSNPSQREPGSVPSEKIVAQETVGPSLAVETRSNTGECGVKVTECTSEMTDLAETQHDPCVDRIKRAALTALSAAAVKSKLLADQEEDEIRQLATFLIEKQLQKIETKLGFFADIENAIMRAKDQMDKSRQRLYHERAQIIAARLGMPPPSSRAMPPSIPSNRAAMSYASSVPKSLQTMNSQMGPVRTISNTSAPSQSFQSISNATRGGSTHTSR